tara:strand:+ start:923 stop:1351 length:429 start_codon:yes stop_codon:yes gene_type:complete
MAQINDDDWEEIYNATDERTGEPREYYKQPGTFYQTYGNGGGPGGSGGFWVRDNNTAVWKVCGDKFDYLNGMTLVVRPQQSLKGQVATCILVTRSMKDRLSQVFMYDDILYKRIEFGGLARLTDDELEYWNNLPEFEKKWSA